MRAIKEALVSEDVVMSARVSNVGAASIKMSMKLTSACELQPSSEIKRRCILRR